MAKKQGDVLVNDAGARPVLGRSLTARGPLSISGKYPDGTKFGPITGYEIEVTYKDVAEALRYAFNSTRVTVGSEIRDAIASRKKPYITQGMLARVNAQGQRSLSIEEKRAQAIETLVENPAAAQGATREEREKIAKLFGLVLPDDDDEVDVGVNGVPEAAPLAASASSDDDFAGYDEDELNKLSLHKLRILAQNHALEGYDDLTKAELIEELVQL